MKKILVILALLPSVLTGCLKSNGGSADDLAIYPGLVIYASCVNQNRFSMEPADQTLRLAMLVAEAAKQGKELSETVYKDKSVQEILFGVGPQIAKQADGSYKITYKADVQLPNKYFLAGSLIVETNGVPQIGDTDSAHPWTVTGENLKLILHQNGMETSFVFHDGSASIYAAGDGTYQISMSDYAIEDPNTTKISDWSGLFALTPADARLVFSGCVGKPFYMSGLAAGPSFFTFDSGHSATELKYVMRNCKFSGNFQPLEGQEEGRLNGVADFNAQLYPARDVTVSWRVVDSRLIETVVYNGVSAEY